MVPKQKQRLMTALLSWQCNGWDLKQVYSFLSLPALGNQNTKLGMLCCLGVSPVWVLLTQGRNGSNREVERSEFKLLLSVSWLLDLLMAMSWFSHL